MDLFRFWLLLIGWRHDGSARHISYEPDSRVAATNTFHTCHLSDKTPQIQP